MDTLEEFFELNKLNKYAYYSIKQSKWKETSQRYISNLLINNIELQKELLGLKYNISKMEKY